MHRSRPQPGYSTAASITAQPAARHGQTRKVILKVVDRDAKNANDDDEIGHEEEVCFSFGRRGRKTGPCSGANDAAGRMTA